jgi:hypothetical protein
MTRSAKLGGKLAARVAERPYGKADAKAGGKAGGKAERAAEKAWQADAKAEKVAAKIGGKATEKPTSGDRKAAVVPLEPLEERTGPAPQKPHAAGVVPPTNEPPSEDEVKLRTWLSAQADALRTCSEAGRHGHALLALDVRANGTVKKAHLMAREGIPAAVESCILARARTLAVPVRAENRLLVNIAM